MTTCLLTCCFDCKHHQTCEMIGQCTEHKPRKHECSMAKERSRCLKFDRKEVTKVPEWRDEHPEW